MSDEKVTKNQKPNDELSAEDLKQVTGGTDAFLKIDGIKGEEQETTHKDWIEVLSFNHDLGK